MKSTVLAGAMLAFSTLGLAACGGADAPAEEAANGPAGLEVSNARVVLPAVSGNPSAVYMEIENSSDRDVMLRAGTVEGVGNYVIHKMGTWDRQMSMDEVMQLPIRSGETVSFDPGEMHMMTDATPETVEAGSTVNVNLSFVGGAQMVVPAKVLAAGEDREAGADSTVMDDL
ncbi:copper chaperone PCu(A)C [Paraurantiacibacter namhicola]|uniref:Copper chaperone PCu(A)C n=1 Tax=Paraurantiacibacter namhicola TaxID=645517 RepID=A0A1C7D932_9SPHN|nr:copper chaperone PCu(A)C [Paraurantiacibacter namhicola]ANU07990.1 hypothetical protein A6F65_01693 [Paraurantiacibacter namhicola]